MTLEKKLVSRIKVAQGRWGYCQWENAVFRKSMLEEKPYLPSCAHVSQYLYKTAYEKQKGHYIGCPSAKEDPKLVWAANVLKMQNDRLYKKAYNDHKAKISIPVDMVSINAAKEGQALASNVDYRQYLHQWSCFPDQNDVIQARKAYDLQSDVSVPGKNALHSLACWLLSAS